MGRPVATCSSPSSSMMPVPEAGRLQRIRRPIAASNGSIDLRREAVRVGRERPLEHDPHHLPVAGGGVLAGAALDQAAVGRLAGAASPSGSPTTSPRPSPARLGSGTSTRSSTCRSVSEPSSPYAAASGSAPGAAAVQHAHEHSGHPSPPLPPCRRRARAGASPGTPRAGARRSRECTTGWSPRWRGRASPARCAGRRPRPAGAWRTSAGTCARWRRPSMSARASTRRRM